MNTRKLIKLFTMFTAASMCGMSVTHSAELAARCGKLESGRDLLHESRPTRSRVTQDVAIPGRARGHRAPYPVGHHETPVPAPEQVARMQMLRSPGAFVTRGPRFGSGTHWLTMWGIPSRLTPIWTFSAR